MAPWGPKTAKSGFLDFNRAQGYAFKTEDFGVGYYLDKYHVNDDGVLQYGPKPEVSSASLNKQKAEFLASVRNVGYDENVTV